jgi:hypothetical protein
MDGNKRVDLDKLVIEQFVPFRGRVIDAVHGKHPQIFSILHAVLSGKKNKVGLQVIEDGKPTGEYTFNMDGLESTGTDTGKLESEIHHPFLGIIKPYLIIERSDLEKIIADEPAFVDDPFSTLPKHLSKLTVKFQA